MKYWVLLLGFIVSLIYADDPDYEIFAAILFIISCIYAFYLIIKLAVKLTKKLFNAGAQESEDDQNTEKKEGVKTQYSEDISEIQREGKSDSSIDISRPEIQNWLQSAQVAGTIDDDGDFSGTLYIELQELGDPDDEIFIESDIVVEISGKKEQSRSYENATVAHGPMELRSSYIRVKSGCDPSYKISASLTAYKFGAPYKSIITVPKGDGDLDLKLNTTSVALKSAKCSWDDDGYCRIVLEFEGELPYGASVALAKPGEDFYPSYVVADDRLLEIQEGTFEINPGEEIEISIKIGNVIAKDVKIEKSGTAQVEARSSLEEDDFFAEENSRDDNNLNVFVACIDNGELSDVLSDEGWEACKTRLMAELKILMDATSEYVDDDARFFLKDAKGKAFEVLMPSDIISKWKLNDTKAVEKALKYADDTYIHLAIIARGLDHWDDGFLRISAEDGAPSFYIWGEYPDVGEIATQGYYDGDFDTGIANDPDDDNYYTGETAMSHYGLTADQFDTSTYGVDG